MRMNQGNCQVNQAKIEHLQMLRVIEDMIVKEAMKFLLAALSPRLSEFSHIKLLRFLSQNNIDSYQQTR